MQCKEKQKIQIFILFGMQTEKVKTKNLIEFLPVNANSILSNLNLVNFFSAFNKYFFKNLFLLVLLSAFPFNQG